MLMQDWKQVRKAISEAEHILLLPHIHADGDSLGLRIWPCVFFVRTGQNRQYFFGGIASREICRFSIAPTDFRKAYNSPYGSPTQSRNCRSTIWRSRWIRAMKSEWEIAKSFFTVQKDKFGSITIFRTLRRPDNGVQHRMGGSGGRNLGTDPDV